MKIFLFTALLVVASIASSAQNKEADNAENSKPVIPVLRTYVPPHIVDKAVKKYGRLLYCISQIKTTNGEPGYLVGLIRNGRLTTELMEDLKIALLRHKHQKTLIAQS